MTGWRQPAGTVTAKQLKGYYKLTGNDLFVARRRLEILGYIEPVRKGSQTYKAKRIPLPETVDDLNRLYAQTNYTYNMPADYERHIALPLRTMVRDFEKWNSGNWGDMNPAIALAYKQLADAVSLLPTFTPPGEFSFTCLPVYDALLGESSRKKRLANIAHLLEELANQLTEVYYFSWTANDLKVVAFKLNQINVPNSFQHSRKVKP